jgi:phosphoserine phosphatase
MPSSQQKGLFQAINMSSQSINFAKSRFFSASGGSDIMAHFSNKNWEGNAVASAMEALANADAVCFDVDSTVIQEEGIDVLAASLGKGEEVAAWTLKAMEGNTKFEDALAARLDIIKPSRASILKCLEKHPLQLSPGIDRLVEVLLVNGTDVYLVSGGFRIMIEPVARKLCIAKTNIYANTLFFDENTNDGEYVGFCRDEPTSADMGKPKAVQKIKDEFGYKTIVMVGDGANDVLAMTSADLSFAMGAGVDLTKTNSDAVLLNNDIALLKKIYVQTARAKKVITQNIAWALLYNVFALPLAALGMVAPYIAVVGMSMSSLVVTLNALRLRKIKGG